METIKLLLIFTAWTILGILASFYANKRGRNPYPWFFIGFFLGLIGLLALFLLPKIKKTEEKPVKKIKKNPPLSDTLWYYLDEDHKRHGPVGQTWLSREIEAKKLNENTFVWNETLKDWKRVKDLEEDL